MKIRETAHAVQPMHRASGMLAPSIMVYADNHAKAKEYASKISTLIKRFPNEWILI